MTKGKNADFGKGSKKRILAAKKAIERIKTMGSSEDFTLKKSVLKSFTKHKNDEFVCKCCKKYFLPHFLDVDHINGKTEISSNKQLQIINYKQGRSGKTLLSWIKKHIDKKIIRKHFQILCHNCNRAKFLYKTCPHERKRSH